ncbi:putative minor head protein [Lactobacillus prophage Lj928]|uniref:Head protein n=2 Tax=Lactobacillaceae TaxID=33958 RepID=A0A921L9R5_9LACO|nr:head protein [Lactobacillus johnsonii]NP_958535.1 minor head protein [Lactobacillus prophage Lj928]HJF87374.1 head protein [Companilactobacillus farciminis]AAR27376.1 putative minor head protein [Lactobacillus prophage Lj928]AAS09204.1 Lj928 prophage minor head protein [Lactobacillus johnsonii NCC 533]MBZ4026363.1 head protein [Lactobacillus johnsonii]MCT3321327.1 head protein [Lactobacillus johnsonii]
MAKKLKVVIVTPQIEKNLSWVALQGTNDIYGHKYLLTDDGKKHEIIGRATQSVEANKKKIVDLLIKGKFDYSSAELV